MYYLHPYECPFHSQLCTDIFLSTLQKDPDTIHRNELHAMNSSRLAWPNLCITDSYEDQEEHLLGMGRYQYRYWHIGTFCSIGSIGIGKPKMLPILPILQKLLYPVSAVSSKASIGVSAKSWYRPIPNIYPTWRSQSMCLVELMFNHTDREIVILG